MFTFSCTTRHACEKSNENPLKIKQKYRLNTNNGLD